MNIKYVDYFLKLKCAPDILGIVSPISAGPAKEISEAVTIIKRLREETVKDPMKYNVLELCAGNPIPSILSVFCQPVEYAVAFDKREIKRDWEKAKRFKYIQGDIYQNTVYDHINENTIIIASHPCSELSKRIVEIYLSSDARSLYFIPCCIGQYLPAEFPQKEFLKNELGRYKAWSFYLASKCGGKLEQDVNCISPANIIIKAKKYK